MSSVFLIAGLGFGDEGKGACVEALTRHLPIDLIVRYNGACQAAHHIVLSNGKSHCFSQFGAGMLVNNRVKTHLSRFMLIEPMAMMREAEALNKLTQNVWWRTTVDAKALIITPFHRNLNRFCERARGDSSHGSCGRGVGVTREMHLKYGNEVLFAGDVKDLQCLRLKLNILRERYWDEISAHPEYDLGKEQTPSIDELLYDYTHWPAHIVDAMEPAAMMVFEGAQGVLLDEKYGAPHNTWTNTTFENADTLLDEAGVSMFDRVRIGCLRTYHTRHGAGPFPTEDNTLDLPEPHNDSNGFQGSFRVGRFDMELAKKAIDIVHGVDCLAISHFDYLPRLGVRDGLFIETVKQLAPIGIYGSGPTAEHRTVDLEVCV